MDTKNYFVHESSYVDEPCQIGKGTKIWHFSHVMKNSIIGENCNIEEYADIRENTSIANNCQIKGSIISDSIIMSNCTFEGKFEIKNSIIGSNSKILQNNSNPNHEFLLGEGSQVSI